VHLGVFRRPSQDAIFPHQEQLLNTRGIRIDTLVALHLGECTFQPTEISVRVCMVRTGDRDGLNVNIGKLGA
jgi:hypothetical protein